MPAGQVSLHTESVTSSFCGELQVVHTVGSPVQVLQLEEQLTQFTSWTTVTSAGHLVKHLFI